MKKKTFILFFILCSLYVLVTLHADTIPSKGYVSPDIGLNVRSSPSESASIITALVKGTTLTIDSVSGKWYKISSPASGYVHGDYVIVTDYKESNEVKTDYNSLTVEERKKIGRNYKKSAANAKIKHTK